jgi:hypothetical protein
MESFRSELLLVLSGLVLELSSCRLLVPAMEFHGSLRLRVLLLACLKVELELVRLRQDSFPIPWHTFPLVYEDSTKAMVPAWV